MVQIVRLQTKFLPQDNYELVWSHYDFHPEIPALVVRDVSTGEHQLTASVNIVRTYLPPDHIWIKNWSVNEGILEALERAGVLESTGHTVPTGFVEADVCRILQREPSLAESEEAAFSALRKRS